MFRCSQCLYAQFFYKISKLWKLIALTKFSQLGNMTPLFYNSHQLSNVVRFLLLNMILLFKCYYEWLIVLLTTIRKKHVIVFVM
jgi:hypothetical protein